MKKIARKLRTNLSLLLVAAILLGSVPQNVLSASAAEAITTVEAEESSPETVVLGENEEALTDLMQEQSIFQEEISEVKEETQESGELEEIPVADSEKENELKDETGENESGEPAESEDGLENEKTEDPEETEEEPTVKEGSVEEEETIDEEIQEEEKGESEEPEISSEETSEEDLVEETEIIEEESEEDIEEESPEEIRILSESGVTSKDITLQVESNSDKFTYILTTYGVNDTRGKVLSPNKGTVDTYMIESGTKTLALRIDSTDTRYTFTAQLNNKSWKRVTGNSYIQEFIIGGDELIEENTLLLHLHYDMVL